MLIYVCVWYFWFTKTLYPHHISGLALRCDWALLISVDKLPGRISSTSLRHPLVSQSLLISFWKYFGFQQCSFLFSLRFRFDIWVGGWVLCVCVHACVALFRVIHFFEICKKKQGWDHLHLSWWAWMMTKSRKWSRQCPSCSQSCGSHGPSSCWTMFPLPLKWTRRAVVHLLLQDLHLLLQDLTWPLHLQNLTLQRRWHRNQQNLRKSVWHRLRQVLRQMERHQNLRLQRNLWSTAAHVARHTPDFPGEWLAWVPPKRPICTNCGVGAERTGENNLGQICEPISYPLVIFLSANKPVF